MCYVTRTHDRIHVRANIRDCFFVRSVNSDGLTPLDVAFLSNNRELVRLLLANGATEGKKLNS